MTWHYNPRPVRVEESNAFRCVAVTFLVRACPTELVPDTTDRYPRPVYSLATKTLEERKPLEQIFVKIDIALSWSP